MILSIILIAFFSMSSVATTFIVYNVIVDRRTRKLNWYKFSVAMILILIITALCIFAALHVSSIPVVKTVSHILDAIVFSFVNYLPKLILSVWFICPLLLAWLYYSVRTVIHVIKSRSRYKKWKKKHLEQEKEEEQNQEKEEVEEIHFLPSSLITSSPIRYNSVLGLSRIYEIAKTQGLQIAESENGYVSVFSSAEGKKKLIEIFNENQLDSSIISKYPSIVFFDKHEAKSITITEARTKIHRGEEIG